MNPEIVTVTLSRKDWEKALQLMSDAHFRSQSGEQVSFSDEGRLRLEIKSQLAGNPPGQTEQ